MMNNNLVRISIFFFFGLLLGCLHTHSFAQGNASATIISPVSARITEPVGISKSIHSFYGSGAVIFSFTVEITPTGGSKGFGGSITLPVTTGVITAAFFPISGFEGYTFTVFLPSSPLMIHNGTNEMLVTSLTSEQALGTDPEMIAGVFVSVTPTNVMVNYN
jgi:hypothetical protein